MLITKIFILVACACAFRPSLAHRGMCSDKQSDKKCYCVGVTDDNNFPVDVAYCNGLGLLDVPYSDQFDEDTSEIDLSMNNITTVEPNRFSSNILTKITLCHNMIEDVNEDAFKMVPQLRELHLHNNRIKSLTRVVFSPIQKLKILDLSYNNINKVPYGMLLDIYIEYLDLSYNPLGESLMAFHTIENVIGPCANLTTIKLNNVELTDLSNKYFEACSQIKNISLTDNRLKNIPTLPQSIEYLDLSGNLLTFISAAYLNYASLKVLKLNRIATLNYIHHYAFFNLKSLTELHITDCNNLEVFTDLAFGLTEHNEHVKPKIIKLNRNALKSLNETYKYFFDHMDSVDLSGNQWECNCEILWIQDYKRKLYNWQNIKCSAPTDLHNREIVSLKDNDLTQCFPGKYGKRAHKIIIPILILAVIVLCLLVFYLIKYAPVWYNGSRNVGPNSPYSIAANMDDD